MERYLLAMDRGTTGITLYRFTRRFSVVLMELQNLAARPSSHSLKLELENTTKSGRNRDIVHLNTPIVEAKVKDGVCE